MSRIYPNIVPENNLRLPDALTIKHGPARLLSRFVLEGDKAARNIGIRLRLRHDWGGLVSVNREAIARGTWYRLPNMFNPDFSDLCAENSYWISGEDEDGEVVVTQAGRIYYWPETTLEQEARLMFYAGREEGQQCKVTAPDAQTIGGVVFYGGSVWVRPDFRGKGLSQLLPRLGRAYAVARWPVDWGISLVTPALVDKGIAAGYGYKHTSYSVFYPGSPWGDVEFAVVSLSLVEAYDDFRVFLKDGVGQFSAPVGSEFSSGIVRDKRVTKTSGEPVFHGSNSLS